MLSSTMYNYIFCHTAVLKMVSLMLTKNKECVSNTYIYTSRNLLQCNTVSMYIYTIETDRISGSHDRCEWRMVFIWCSSW